MSSDAEKSNRDDSTKKEHKKRSSNADAILKEDEPESKRQREMSITEQVKEVLDEVLKTNGALSLVETLEQQRFSHLIDNPDFWRAFLDSHIYDIPPQADLRNLFHNHPATSVLCDKQLAIELCTYDSHVYYPIPSGNPLESDEDVVKAILESNPRAVFYLTDEALEQHPQHVAKALTRLPLSQVSVRERIKNSIPPSLWGDKNVVLGWAAGNGGWHDGIPENLRLDEEVFLALHEQHTGNYPTIDFEPNDPHVNNKIFLVKAVEKNAKFLFLVPTALHGDFDLAVAAMSGKDGHRLALEYSIDFIPPGDVSPFSVTHRFWRKVACFNREKLITHEVFAKIILPSIRFSEQSPFATLDQDDETLLALKMNIAEFAGVLTGDELGRHRRARSNFALAGIRWNDPKY